MERGTISNLAGTVWLIALALVSVPFLMRSLGPEAFGLTGFFLTVQSLCTFLDLGVGATLTRELPRLSGRHGSPSEQRDLVFTLQGISWAAALFAGIVIVSTAPWIASRWLNAQHLSVDTVEACVRMMGVAVAVQFPLTFYRCGLLGLHRPGLCNAVFAGTSVLRWPAAVIAVMVVPAPQTFFAAQIVAGVGTPVAAVLLWRALPKAGEPVRFQRLLIQRLWRFSALYSTNSTAMLILQQADKMIVSSILSLESFGYYSLAQRLVGGLFALIVAVNSTTFPHLSAAAAQRDEAALARLYHRACQLMAVLIAPLVAVTVFFSREIVFLWTRSVTAAENAHLLVALAAAGMLLHAIIQGPYYLQVAFGAWKWITITNFILLVTILPVSLLLASRYGAAGAASVALLLNAAYVVTVPLVHRRFVRGELRRWIVRDVAAPLCTAFVIAGCASVLMPGTLGWLARTAWLGTTAAAAGVGVLLVSPDLRRGLEAFVRSRSTNPELA